MDLDLWRANIIAISERATISTAVGATYVTILEYVVREQFRGACHAIAAILHVLLRAQGISSLPVTGELSRHPIAFNHSWVDVSGLEFDVAVALPLKPQFDGNPVFAGRDLETLGTPYWTYGSVSGKDDDPQAQIVKAMTFLEYMDNAPYHRNGLWYFVQKFGARHGLKISLNKVREAHRHDCWVQR